MEWLALARFVNWPPTLVELLKAGHGPTICPQWTQIGHCIDDRAKRGEKTWTGAYMVRAESNAAKRWAAWGKGRYIAEIVVGRELATFREALCEAMTGQSRQQTAKQLCRCYGWGAFMAGQAVDDWSWTPLLAQATDLYTWAPQGPGSQRGLNRLTGRPLTAKFKDEEWCQQLVELRTATLAKLGREFSDITLMDIQNCLCEFDKYERVRLGEGRPRSHYQPEMAY